MSRRPTNTAIDDELARSLDALAHSMNAAFRRGNIAVFNEPEAELSHIEAEILRLLAARGGTMDTMPANMTPDEAMSALNDLARKGHIILDVVPAPGMMSFRIAVRSVESIRAARQ